MGPSTSPLAQDDERLRRARQANGTRCDDLIYRRRLRTRVVIVLGAAVIGVAQLMALRQPQQTDLTYDGRFTFVRLRWGSDFGSSRRGGFSSAWNHDYPRAEQHLSLILKELTVLDIRTDRSQVLTLDDPELFNYPIAFMWEPGFWNLTDAEAASFRAYLLKGGFAVFEDFDGPQQWSTFEAQMRRVIPDGRFVKLDNAARIFDSFFQVKNIDAIVHPMSGIRPSYYGLFEENDPSKRLIAVANFDNDVPEYWEWSGEGVFPFDTSNDAYKLGVNYVIYGLTH
jgi:hypothetical protein